MTLDELTLATTAHNNWEDLAGMLASAEATVGAVREILVVDDGSREARTPEAKAPLRVIRNASPKCFTGAAADALAAVRTPYALLVDADVRFLPGPFAEAYAAFCADPAAAWVGFRQVTPKGEPGGCGERFAAPPTLFALGNAAWTTWQQKRDLQSPADGAFFLPMEIVFSSAVLVRLAHYRAVGGFDQNFRQAVVDYDLSTRLRAAGHRVGCYPSYTVQHEGHDSNTGGDRRIFDTYSGYLYFYEKTRPIVRTWLRPVLFFRHLAEAVWCLIRGDSRVIQRWKLALRVWSGYSRKDGKIVAWQG